PGFQRTEDPKYKGGREPALTSAPVSVHAAPPVSAPCGGYRCGSLRTVVIAVLHPAARSRPVAWNGVSKPSTSHFRGRTPGLIAPPDGRRRAPPHRSSHVRLLTSPAAPR